MTTAPDARYYELFFLWIHDPAKFARYGELVGPVVTPYGNRIDRQIRPTSIAGEGIEQPDIVNLASSPSLARLQQFERDPRFQEIVHLRSESIDLGAVTGPARRYDPGPGDAAQRLYLVELARFGDGGEAAYRAYEKESEPVMARYGYRVEAEIVVRTSSHLPFVPDIAKVAYFDAPDGMDRMHGDPMHDRIENVLYPAATRDSLWILGRAPS